MLKKIFDKFHILQNIYLKNKHFIKKKSYSMDGEDLEIVKYFENLNNGFYVDVGSYHPIEMNNTYLLYKKNWKGINIDTSKFSIDLFNFLRPDDLNYNLAISNKDGEHEYYYQKKLSKLSTLKKTIAKGVFQGNFKTKKIITSKLSTLIDKTKFKNKKIDFLNVDAEGSDLDVLKSLNFDIYRPKLICVEIITNPSLAPGYQFSHITKLDDSEIYKFLIKLNYIKTWSGVFSHLFADNLLKKIL